MWSCSWEDTEKRCERLLDNKVLMLGALRSFLRSTLSTVSISTPQEKASLFYQAAATLCLGVT